MSILRKNVLITPEEYLEGEKYSEVKHEYVAGHIYAMVGASEPHNQIAINLTTALKLHLRGGPCRVFMSDMKVRVRDAFYYPDVLVSCDRTDTNKYYKTRPKPARICPGGSGPHGRSQLPQDPGGVGFGDLFRR